MKIDRVIGIIGGAFILAGIGAALFLPAEKKWNKDADIRVGIRSRHIRCDHGGDIAGNQ